MCAYVHPFMYVKACIHVYVWFVCVCLIVMYRDKERRAKQATVSPSVASDTHETMLVGKKQNRTSAVVSPSFCLLIFVNLLL